MGSRHIEPPIQGRKVLNFVAWWGNICSFSVPGTRQNYLPIFTSSDVLPVNSFSFQCLFLNLFLSFPCIEPDDMWDLPLDRKSGKSRGCGEIGYSQLYMYPGWMTGYPEGTKAETRFGISVPCETPERKLLPRPALPILPPVLSSPGPTALPTFPRPHHGKLQACLSKPKLAVRQCLWECP